MSPANVKAADALTEALRDVKFRSALSGADNPDQVANDVRVSPGDLPPGLLNTLSSLTEDELNAMANINAKAGKVASISNGYIYF